MSFANTRNYYRAIVIDRNIRSEVFTNNNDVIQEDYERVFFFFSGRCIEHH